jgi:bacillithiol synthase
VVQTSMFSAERVAYKKTNCFSRIVEDYLDGTEKLQPFFSFTPTLEGAKAAIKEKQKQNIDRKTLVEVLRNQYKEISISKPVSENIEKLLSENTFSICTAHQPNLFTGPLYFIYKIVHAIKLAGFLKEELPKFDFVPVFYMGSEDADLAELDHFTVKGKTYRWKTKQTGAVGRMLVDKELTGLIDELETQIAVEENGKTFIGLLKESFQPGTSIQTSTLKLVNSLFGDYGLVVLIADEARLKKQMIPVFREDIFEHIPAKLVEKTCTDLGEHYNVQANPRDINLFYLRDDLRERIEGNSSFSILHSPYTFTRDELLTELNEHPERFSPNVILRGLYQETILPNIIFIGGGGELAYWLQLKQLFENYKIPFPLLVLRNSFLVEEKKHKELAEKLNLKTEDLFLAEAEILNKVIEAEGKKPVLNGQLGELNAVYEKLKHLAADVDVTLLKHVEALQVKASNNLLELERKMLRSERKKHEASKRQVEKLKKELFPANGLQERVENISYYYSKFGKSFIDELLKHSLGFEQEFTVLVEE